MPTPRSALLHLDGSARTVERIRSARQLADTFEADVAGLPCTLSTLMRYPFAVEAATEAVAIMQRPDKEVAMARAGRTSGVMVLPATLARALPKRWELWPIRRRPSPRLQAQHWIGVARAFSHLSQSRRFLPIGPPQEGTGFRQTLMRRVSKCGAWLQPRSNLPISDNAPSQTGSNSVSPQVTPERPT